MAQALIKGSSLYANPYEEAYTRAKFLRNFNQNTWEEAILRGDQDRYLKLLRDTDKVDLDASFYDPLQYSYENQILQLEAQLADDTEIKDYSNLKDVDSYKEFIRQKAIADGVDLKRTTLDKDYAKQIKDKYQPMLEGQITDKMYLDYIIKQDRAAKEAEITYLRERAHKEAMSGWTKVKSIGAFFGEIGEGALRGLAAFFDVIPAAIYGTVTASMDGVGGKNWFDAFTEYYDLGLMSMESNVGNALAEYERKYTSFRTIDGELTTSGKYLGQTANAIGYMLPSIVLASVTGGASIGYGALQIGVGNLAFYTQIFSQNVYENQTNPLTSGSPGELKFFNALTQSVSEAAIEYGLTKVLGLFGIGASTVDRLRGAGQVAGKAKNMAKFVDRLGEVSTKKGMLNGLKYLGIDALHEGLEEFFQDMGDMGINYFTDMLMDGYGYNEYEKGIDMQTLIDSFITGALMSIAMTIGGGAIKRGASRVERTFFAGHEYKTMAKEARAKGETEAENYEKQAKEAREKGDDKAAEQFEKQAKEVREKADVAAKLYESKVEQQKSLRIKDRVSQFDTIVNEHRLGILQSVAFNSIMEQFNESVKDLVETKIDEGDAEKIMSEMVTLNTAATEVGQFFAEISPERLANVKKFFDYIKKHPKLLKTDKAGLRKQIDKGIKDYKKMAEEARKAGDEKTAKYYEDRAKYYEKHAKTIIRKRQSAQLQMFADEAQRAIATMLTVDSKIKFTKKAVENAITRTVEEVNRRVARGGDNSVAEASMSTVTGVSDGENLSLLEREIDDKFVSKAKKKLAALHAEYDMIFLTDGNSAVENGSIAFVPVEWLNNYSESEIYKFLTNQKIVGDLLNNKKLTEASKPGEKSFFDQLVDRDAALRGVDVSTISREQALMDFLFNPSVYTDMLFGDNGIYFRENVAIITSIFGMIEEEAKKAKNKKAYKELIEQLRSTMRIPTMKAILAWPDIWLDPNLGLYKILSEQDRQYINMEIKRRAVLATGSPRNAFEALTEDTFRDIDLRTDLETKAPKLYEQLQQFKKDPSKLSINERKNIVAFINWYNNVRPSVIHGILMNVYRGVRDIIKDNASAEVDIINASLEKLKTKAIKALAPITTDTEKIERYIDLCYISQTEADYMVADAARIEIEAIKKDFGIINNYTNIISETNLVVPAEAYYMRRGENNPDRIAIDEVFESFNKLFGNFDDLCAGIYNLAPNMTLEELGKQMGEIGASSLTEFALVKINDMLYQRFKDQRYFVRATVSNTLPESFDDSTDIEEATEFYTNLGLVAFGSAYEHKVTFLAMMTQLYASIKDGMNGIKAAVKINLLNAYNYMDKQTSKTSKYKEALALPDYDLSELSIEELADGLRERLILFSKEIINQQPVMDVNYRVLEGIPIDEESLNPKLLQELRSLAKRDGEELRFTPTTINSYMSKFLREVCSQGIDGQLYFDGKPVTVKDIYAEEILKKYYKSGSIEMVNNLSNIGIYLKNLDDQVAARYARYDNQIIFDLSSLDEYTFTDLTHELNHAYDYNANMVYDAPMGTMYSNRNSNNRMYETYRSEDVYVIEGMKTLSEKSEEELYNTLYYYKAQTEIFARTGRPDLPDFSWSGNYGTNTNIVLYGAKSRAQWLEGANPDAVYTPYIANPELMRYASREYGTDESESPFTRYIEDTGSTIDGDVALANGKVAVASMATSDIGIVTTNPSITAPLGELERANALKVRTYMFRGQKEGTQVHLNLEALDKASAEYYQKLRAMSKEQRAEERSKVPVVTINGNDYDAYYILHFAKAFDNPQFKFFVPHKNTGGVILISEEGSDTVAFVGPDTSEKAVKIYDNKNDTAEAKPAESKPAEPKPAEPKPAEPKPAESKPAEPKPAEPKPAEPKPAESKPAEPKPAEPKPAEPKPAKPKPTQETSQSTPEAKKWEALKTRLTGRNFVTAFTNAVKGTEAHSEKIGTFHDRATSDKVISAINRIVDPNLDAISKNSLTIDQIIKSPGKYLNEKIKKLLGDRIKNEGYVYSFLQGLISQTYPGVSLDVSMPGDITTAKYVLVDDKAFDDVFSSTIKKQLDNKVENDVAIRNLLLTKQKNGETITLADIYDKYELELLGIPSDIVVKINDNSKGASYFEVTAENPKGIMHINFKDTMKHQITDTDLLMKINHEFRHVLQVYNKLSAGASSEFVVTDEILADIKNNVPEIFKDPEVRRIMTEKGDTNKDVDKKIAQAFVYLLTSGEINARGVQASFVGIKPVHVAKSGDGKIRAFMPWYDAENKKGAYELQFNYSESKNYDDYDDENLDDMGFSSFEGDREQISDEDMDNLWTYMQEIVDAQMKEAFKDKKDVTEADRKKFQEKAYMKLQAMEEIDIVKMWRELQAKKAEQTEEPAPVNEPVVEPTVSQTEQRQVDRVVDTVVEEQAKQDEEISAELDTMIDDMLHTELAALENDEERDQSRARLRSLIEAGGAIRRGVNRIVSLNEDQFNAAHKYGIQLPWFTKKRVETAKASRYVPKTGQSNYRKADGTLAEFQETNLKYFFKKGSKVQMTVPLRNFIVSTTDIDEEIDPVIMASIKDGKLTQQTLLGYFVSERFGKTATETQKQKTFELINEAFFANESFKSLEDLDKLTNSVEVAWAAAVTLARYGFSMEALLEQNNLERFLMVLNSEKLSDIREVIMTQASYYDTFARWESSPNGKPVIATKNVPMTDSIKRKMKLIALRYFDGSMSSAYYIGSYGRRLLLEQGKLEDANIDSLSRVIQGKDRDTETLESTLSENRVNKDADEAIDNLYDYYVARSAPIDSADDLSESEKLDRLCMIQLEAMIADLFKSNPGLSEEELKNYRKEIQDAVHKFRNAFMIGVGKKATINVDAVNEAWSNTVMDNAIDNNRGVVVDVLTAAKNAKSLATLQRKAKRAAATILRYTVKERRLKFESLPPEIQAMFEKKGNKYVLKDEVYKVGRGREVGDRTDFTRESFAKDTAKVEENVKRLTKYADELKDGRHVARATKDELHRNRVKRLEKQVELLKKQMADMKAGRGAFEETTIKLGDEKKRGKKGEATRNNDTITVVSFQNKPVPQGLTSLLKTSFSQMVDTHIQHISRSIEGQIYERGTKGFKGDLQHERTSLNEFMDLNLGALQEWTTRDVLEIISFFKGGAMLLTDTPGAAGKFAAFEVFTLAYIVGNMDRNPNWALSEEEKAEARELFANRASLYGTGLRAIGEVQDIIDPYKHVFAQLKEYGIEAKDLVPLQLAIERYNKAETQEAQRGIALEINREIGVIEGKMKQKKIRFRDKVQAYSYVAKLSSPLTWLRNIVTNVEMTGMNIVSDKIMGFIFSKLKKAYRVGQIDFAGTTATREVRDWSNKNIFNNPLLRRMYGGQTKYDPKYGVTGQAGYEVKFIDANGKTKTAHLDAFIRIIAEDLISDWRSAHKFVDDENENKLLEIKDKAFQAASKFIMWAISDSKFIEFATKQYFNKLLQLRVDGKYPLFDKNNHFIGYADKLVLNENTMLTQSILQDFVESIRLASADYMHKPSLLADFQAWLKREYPNWAYAWSLFAPFVNSSLNFYTEALKLTPVGLAGAIARYARLEEEIGKRQELRRLQKGKMLTDPRFVESQIRRDIGKGIIGTIGLVTALIFAGLGIVRVIEEDDKYKLQLGDNVTLDVSTFLGTSSFITGLAIVSNIQNSAGKKWYEVFEKSVVATYNALSDGFPLRDVFDRYSYASTFGDAVLTFSDNFFRGFVPQAVQFLTAATRYYDVKYSSGLKGKIQKFIDSWSSAGSTWIAGSDFIVDPYTGEKQSKWAIPVPVVGSILGYGLKKSFGLYWTRKSAGQELSESLGVKKNPLTGKLTINGESIQLDYTTVNEKYGQLNAASLSSITKGKHRVQMKDGTYKELSWSQLDDKQKANVLNRMYDRNADIARIYAWTADGHKYYTGKDYLATLKKAGVKNVYYGDKGFVE